MMAACTARIPGCIFDLQHASVVDGPGLRSVVFFKGCPLRCLWCHNPEGIRPGRELLSDHAWCGREVTAAEVIREVAGELDYYQATGGGLTISGGEPLHQPEFAKAVLVEAKKAGLHTCLDTSGCVPRATLEQVIPSVDLVLFDYKATGDELHRKLTGESSAVILANLRFLCRLEVPVILRCPMIPSLNDTELHFAAIANLAREYQAIRQVDILPYHSWGRGKPKPLWGRRRVLNIPPVDQPTLARWDLLLRQTGNIKAVIR
jgi:pyruvate formate lyase activating enzyme